MASDDGYDSAGSLVDFIVDGHEGHDEDDEAYDDDRVRKDLQEILSQSVDGGTVVVEGRRRSTRLKKEPERYVDSDYEDLMFSSNEDLSGSEEDEADQDNDDEDYMQEEDDGDQSPDENDEE